MAIDWNEYENRRGRYGLPSSRPASGTRGKNHTIRSLMPDIVWFDGAVQAYMAPKLAKAMGDSGALVMTIARNSTRKHRRKRIQELTPYERDYFLPGVGVLRVSQLNAARKRAQHWPNMPGEPGGPARYSPGSATSLDGKNTIFFGFDKTTRSMVVGRILLASRRSQAAVLPQLTEHGGMAPISYGPSKGRMAWVKARPTMRLAFNKARPKIERFFSDSNTRTSTTVQDGSFQIRTEHK